ncbi:MAG: S41 family peptidase [Acholeplasma sp.]|nr:S41 family peptidase [Acholeplasma sp.]
MALVKTKKILLIVIGLLIGFLSGCSEFAPAFLTRPAEYELYTILDNYYYKPLDFELNDVKSIDEIIEKLKDPYTYIYEQNTRTIELNEAYHGIGISVTDIQTGLLVTEVNPFSGYNTMIYPFDVITKINDQSLDVMSYQEKQTLLVGELGDEFVLGIRRGDLDLTVKLKVKEIPLNSVTYQMLDNQIGLIDINRFSSASSDLFVSYLEQLESVTLNGLIIDVRNNGGGYLAAVVEILKAFMTGEEAFVSMHRVYDNHYDKYYPTPGKTRKIYPIVVLINQNSASASEVLAIAMRENGGYYLMGEKSYGKDVYQVSYALKKQGEHTFLNMTQGYWLSPNLNSVKGGIEPDETVSNHQVFELPYPVYEKELTLNDSLERHEALVEMVNLLETSTKEFNETLFTIELEAKVLLLQKEHQLQVTGTLNYETTLYLINEYQQRLIRSDYDLQKQSAIEYLVAYENN